MLIFNQGDGHKFENESIPSHKKVFQTFAPAVSVKIKSILA